MFVGLEGQRGFNQTTYFIALVLESAFAHTCWKANRLNVMDGFHGWLDLACFHFTCDHLVRRRSVKLTTSPQR